MNESLKKIFEGYVASYESIQRLRENGSLNDDVICIHEHKLLVQIIKTTKAALEL